MKNLFESDFAHPIMLFLSHLFKNSMDHVCDMQISDEMVPNAHVPCQSSYSGIFEIAKRLCPARSFFFNFYVNPYLIS